MPSHSPTHVLFAPPLGRGFTRATARFVSPLSALVVVAAMLGCGGDNPPGETYYERRIEPILQNSCSGQTAGCHEVGVGDPFGFAAGNFDVTSFETVQKRRDLLRPFGAYGIPLLLVKAVGGSPEIGVNYRGEFHPLEVQHVSGGVFGVGADAYLTLLEWTNNGATEDGLPPLAPPRDGEGACSTFVPPGFDESAYTSLATFAEFRDNVQPVLANCNAGSCHGAPQSDFYVSCGDDTRQLAFNFSQAWSFVDTPVDNTQILQVPLAVSSGGYFHTGGEHFSSRSADNYAAVRTWAEKVGRIEFGEGDPGREFFADQVQPILLTRGCSFEACHSPQSTNDFQLRSGSQGFFSAIALERNYDKLLEDFMAPEVPDARRGRAVAKGILESFGGIAHRGGPVLETPGSGGAQPETCPNPYDPLAASAYCVVQEWIRIEREKLITAGQIDRLAEGETVGLVYVERETNHVADVHEYDTYQANSELFVDQMTIGAGGALTAVGAPASLLENCPNTADRTTVDVRSPDVHPDGQRVTFAMRTGAADPLGVYTVNIDGTGCTRVTPSESPVSGLAIHNFDPAFSPDGNSIVFASTRGGETAAPTLGRQFFQPQSDIWRMQLDGSGREQMTFLTNSELAPQFMREGRMTMTTEKISDGFYQLSGRRMNWDLTDYHPLLAQRSDSGFADGTSADALSPSVGYQRATEVREGFDGNFLVIFSDPGTAAGAGTLGIFNRSVGTFEAGRTDPGFLESVEIPDPAATGRVGQSTQGAYRSPSSLLDGRVLVSYAAVTGDLGTIGTLNFDLVALNPRTGAREVLIGGPRAQLEGVLAIKRPTHEPYLNRRQLVFGGRADPAATGGVGSAIVHFPDLPLVFTLLNANLRRGRPTDGFASATHLAVYEEGKAPSGSGANMGSIYQQRTSLGRAALAEDGSLRVRVPSGTPLILELQDSSGAAVVTMKEEHQLGPGETITFGIARPLFDAVCGGCHGTVSGQELDVFVTPDALTGASQSLSIDSTPSELQ